MGIIVKLLMAGLPAARLVARYGAKAVKEARKHIKDKATKRTAGQKKIVPVTKGQRQYRKGTRVAAVTSGTVVGTGAVVGTTMVLSGKNKKKVQDALEKGMRDGQIETLLRQAIKEQKKEEASKNKPMPRPKNLISGAVKSARKPPSRPSSIR